MYNCYLLAIFAQMQNRLVKIETETIIYIIGNYSEVQIFGKNKQIKIAFTKK